MGLTNKAFPDYNIPKAVNLLVSVAFEFNVAVADAIPLIVYRSEWKVLNGRQRNIVLEQAIQVQKQQKPEYQ